MSGRLEGCARPSVVVAARPIAIGSTRRAAWSPDYAVQWDQVSVSDPVELTRFEEDHPALVFSDGWRVSTDSRLSGGAARWTSSADASVEVMFEGQHVRWIGSRGPARGFARVEINGDVVDEVNLYAPSWEWQQVLFQVSVEGEGPHTLRIVNTGGRDPAATSARTEIDAIEAEGLAELNPSSSLQ